MNAKVLFASSILLFAILTCSPQPKKGLRMDRPDGPPRYFAHQYSFDAERADPVMGEHEPAGLVLTAQLGGRLNQPVGGARSLQELGPILDSYPDLFPVISTFLGASLYPQLCGNGRLDEDLDRLETWLKEIDRPVGLVIGYQVENPIWEVDPDNFKEGFRCLVDRFVDAGLDKVSFGWHPNGVLPTYGDQPLNAWFPGGEYVNFIGLTLEKIIPAHFANKMAVTGTNFDEVYSMSEKHAAPIIIMEATPGSVRKVMPGSGDTLWTNYYEPLANFLEEHDNIIAVAHHSGSPADSLTRARYRKEFIPRYLSTTPLFKR